ncbi:hypothetical protein ABZ234_31825 [Nocardiopsis sp. NPDC006198]|uniref:hypothetical protein n=1 Tax=Nocardiopsis sp. NPDC006198 TaxID=3154472 RepID=UPI0033B20115
MFQPVDIGLLGALALPVLASHTWGDHPFQSSVWAKFKGECSNRGRLACAKHTAVIVGLRALAVGLVLAVTATVPDPLAIAVGLGFTGWSHYWADRRYTLLGLWRAIGRQEFAALGTPRPGRDDNPSLGSGAYRLDQDFHTLFLAVSALLMSSTGWMLALLTAGATALMAAAILASRHGRRLQALDRTPA